MGGPAGGSDRSVFWEEGAAGDGEGDAVRVLGVVVSGFRVQGVG